MLKQYLLYDQDGYYIEPIVTDFGEDPLPEGVTELNFGHMGKPRFVAGQWVDEAPELLIPPELPESSGIESRVEAMEAVISDMREGWDILAEGVLGSDV